MVSSNDASNDTAAASEAQADGSVEAGANVPARWTVSRNEVETRDAPPRSMPVCSHLSLRSCSHHQCHVRRHATWCLPRSHRGGAARRERDTRTPRDGAGVVPKRGGGGGASSAWTVGGKGTRARAMRGAGRWSGERQA